MQKIRSMVHTVNKKYVKTLNPMDMKTSEGETTKMFVFDQAIFTEA
jgi:hypothetical protein